MGLPVCDDAPVRNRLLLTVAFAAIAAPFFAQAPAPAPRVDFARDVQPLFRQHCIGCHGPTIHQNGFRLDRRADAMRGGTIAVIGPGNSAGSRLYMRLIGSGFGPQMPPTGALKADQIRVIKDWIDQGAEWPDALAGDGPPAGPPPPLMAAALSADAAAMRRLLDRKADPNARNAAGATALMWSVGDIDKVRLLLERGADANLRSDDDRTALLIAAGQPGGADVVQLLLEWGADLWVGKRSDGSRALIEAAYAGEAETVRVLRDAGADLKDAGAFALGLAVHSRCEACIDMLALALDADAISAAALVVAPPDDDGHLLQPLLARGASASAKDETGRTVLLRAAATDLLPADIITTLTDRGADVREARPDGLTALGLAKMRGNAAVIAALNKAGAPDGAGPAVSAPPPAPAPSLRAALERSLPLIQASDVTFLKKAGCVSCHNNSVAAIAVSAARRHGVRVDEAIARSQIEVIARYLESWRERALQGMGIPGDTDTVSYILVGLAAERHPADAATDAMTAFMLRQQAPDGQWRILAHRPPIESSSIEVTAMTVRALHAYAPARLRAASDAAIRRAAVWMSSAPAVTTEDRAFQLLGLGWTRASAERVQNAARALVAEQRADGGWAQLSTIDSDAYATGLALVALDESGALARGAPAFDRGLEFLRRTQMADGSWHVRSRVLPIQPYFESGFPHGRDQFVSAAATSWAAAALAASIRP